MITTAKGEYREKEQFLRDKQAKVKREFEIVAKMKAENKNLKNQHY